ncbi:hypothetical protein BCR44DRAFT_121206 [Catenaria anguillulae PL171]|uniref:ubiquitinyl hydrolase 1 n=1 Tax=Catenaria anguillulae PL171 TaxID=765915 RepID=A0A1Y2HJW4_9FUNG|nr:hypothetical protein BCR44DRAFT_121206 [Catenaria anguillulae PL171]
MQSTYERQESRTDVYGNALGSSRGSGHRQQLPTAPPPINTSFPTLTQPVPVTRPIGASQGPPRSSSLNSTTSSPVATVPPTLPPRIHKPQPAIPTASSAILGSTLARGRPRLATPTSASPLMTSGGAGSMLLSPRIAAAANARASILSTTQFDYRFHDSEAAMSEVVGAGVAGLKNMGNSCYQNSVLQCLFGAVPLIRYFSSGDFKSHINPSNPLGSKGAVAKAYFSLVHDWKRNAGASVAPVAFRDMLADHAPHFATRDQQDSQEFLTYLLDALHEDLKHPPPAGSPLPPDDNDDLLSIGDVATAASIAWQRYLVRNASFVSQWFMGQLRSSIECLTCHAQSVTYAPFTSLSVPVVGDQVTDGLGELLRPEILDGEDAWKCPRCKVARKAEKRLVVARVPPVLILHIKRFEYVGPFRNKIDKLVRFPLRGLDLRGVVPSGGQGAGQAAVFDLFAVSNHYGGLDGGHYTAIVKHGGGWHYFDDSRVSKCGEDKVVTNAAYTLFYRQREGGEAAAMGNKL